MTAFNRYSKLCEAICRRWAYVLFSMYFDDATIQDWASADASGQATVRKLMKLLGDALRQGQAAGHVEPGDIPGLDA